MSAVPVNDDERPLGLAAFSAVRTLGSMDAADLQALLAHVAGHLVERRGVLTLATVMAGVLNAARRVGEPMTLAEIALQVAIKHGLSVDDLRMPAGLPGARTNDLAFPRHEAFWLAWQQRRPDGKRRFTSQTIGKYFGGRDHSTVLWGVQRHTDHLLREPIT
jgi:chromosomal replication initiation ATPase DnaA